MNSFAKVLEFRADMWMTLVAELRRRGRGRREAGAFLLGVVRSDAKVVHTILPYEELDSDALNYDYIRLSSEAFSRLWTECAQRGLEVVGDVHTHPCGPSQSSSDRAHPMISIAGHMALIVPRFALGNVAPADVSVNVYLGSGRWQSYLKHEAAARIKLLKEEHGGR